jgi:hypothetical protein
LFGIPPAPIAGTDVPPHLNENRIQFASTQLLQLNIALAHEMQGSSIQENLGTKWSSEQVVCLLHGAARFG